MYNMGTFQLLEVVGEIQGGYAIKSGEDDPILLPTGECIGDIEMNDNVMVFVYKDTKDRLVATMKTPLATVGDIAYLKVVDMVEFGGFAHIGLQRDIFIPLQEMETPLKINNSYLFRVYLDKTSRLCATTKIYNILSTDHSYKTNDRVKATVVKINPEVGVFVAVDDKFQGMIPKNEYFENFELGQVVELRVIRVREDKKLDLATRRLVADQLVVDSEKIYSKLLAEGGKLYFHDKSSPDAIKAEFEMSKKAFKRAVGRLLKDNKIEIYEEFIQVKGDF